MAFVEIQHEIWHHEIFLRNKIKK